MEQQYSAENFKFLYETRLRKLGMEAPHIAEDLRNKLGGKADIFDLEAVEKKYPDGSTLTLTVTNFSRGKKEENKNMYFLNGPINVQYISPDGEFIKARVPIDNQQGPHLDSIKNIMDNNTPYMSISTSKGTFDKMFILTGEKDEQGYRLVQAYGANIEQLEKKFHRLPIVEMSLKQKEYLLESLMKGNVHKAKLRNEQGERQELFVQASSSSDILLRNHEGQIVSLSNSGLERVTKEAQPQALARAAELMEKGLEKVDNQTQGQGRKTGK